MATLEEINIGQAANDKKGDPLRNAMQKVNTNFSKLNLELKSVWDSKGAVNGFAPLDGNGRLPMGYASYSLRLPTTAHDLNTYTAPGMYVQATSAGVSAGANYPIASQGWLEVIPDNTASSVVVMQRFTARASSAAGTRVFVRTQTGTAGSWVDWAEIPNFAGVFGFMGVMPGAQNLNDYTQRGIWIVGSSNTASGGTNYPIGHSGVLLVLSGIHPGQAAGTTGIVQVYVAANSNRLFFRTLSGTWSTWDEAVRTSLMGAPGGAATLDSTGKIPQIQIPGVTATPLGVADNLNNIDVPGTYSMNSNATALLELNYPVLLAGILTVETSTGGNKQVTQTYVTNPASSPRTFRRIRFGSSLFWGPWFEIARIDQVMSRVSLTSATDANSLTADNTLYTWATSAVVSGGSNWPPAPASAVGFMEVVVLQTGAVLQTVTLRPATTRRTITYQRSSTGSTWGGWFVVGSVSLASDLPTANCGDVYVDGDGWYTWGTSAYIRQRQAVTLPASAHDLNTYTLPGVFWQNQSSGATLANNYPIAGVTGFLNVENFGTATWQEFVSRISPFRRFWRLQTNSTTWGDWIEYASTSTAMTHTFLTSATDANTLTADNTFYTWTASASLGANFPAFSTNWPAAGYMRVYYGAATQISQELTYLVTGQKPRTFMRFGNSSTGVWQPWKSTSAWHAATGLPASDMGDIYVDGDGWYRWGGTAYVRSDLSYQSISETNASIFGRGQAWADLTASRVIGSTYTNTTGRPILVNVTGTLAGADGGFVFTVDGLMLSRPAWSGAFTGGTVGYTELIRPGANYSVGVSNMNNFKWSEYR